MPIRNPFKKSGASLGGEQAQDEVDRPDSRGGSDRDLDKGPVDGTKPATALSIKGSREEPNEYKLSGASPVLYEFVIRLTHDPAFPLLTRCALDLSPQRQRRLPSGTCNNPGHPMLWAIVTARDVLLTRKVALAAREEELLA
jgi:hypothetical protein